MKSKIYLGILSLVCVMCWSCSFDRDMGIQDAGTVHTEFGEITHISSNYGNDGYLEIACDTGERLKVVENRHKSYNISVGQRVCLRFTVVRSAGNYAEVILLDFKDFVSGRYYSQSDINADQSLDTFLGSDSFATVGALVSGRWCNIVYSYASDRNGSARHGISLVWDDTVSGDDIHLTLRHNANGDAPAVTSNNVVSGLASFDIADITNRTPAGTKIFIHWNNGTTEVSAEISGYGKFSSIVP